ncbi:hypothetical protein H1R20_g11856, partial [Candolleomyces eurysporus]
MGISGLLPALKCIQTTRHLKEYAGQRVAVDAYVWLHKGVYACATDLATGKSTTRYVDYAMHKVRLMRHHKVEPYIVFDGGPLPAKKGTESERRKKREENLARGKALTAQGKHTQARECYIKCADVTPQMAFQLIKALRAERVSYIVAPYEADAQLAYLERLGIVDAILTEDSDLLVFGCRNVLFKLDANAATVVSISREQFGSVAKPASDISLVGWSDAQFRAMAILSGCDYLPSIPGIGLKTACTLLRKWKTVEQVIRVITLEGKKAVPPDYAQKFKLAEKCFQHQRVYCPLEGKLVPMTPVDSEWADELDQYCGIDLEPEIAKQLANGDLDPVDLEPIVDINPTYRPQPINQIPMTTVDVSKKGKGKEVAGRSRPSGGLHDFFGPNPVIPRTKATLLTTRQQSQSTAGKASGKRTLVEIADQDIAARKKHKPRHSTPAMLAQSRFFMTPGSPERARSASVSRRHSADFPLPGPSRLFHADKENILPGGGWEDEEDASELSFCAQKQDDSDVDLDLETPPDVEQEDGYQSPLAPTSPGNYGQDLSSPSQGAQYDDMGDPVSSPPSASKRRRSRSRSPCAQRSPNDNGGFSGDLVETPKTVRKIMLRRSVSLDAGIVLVDETPSPCTRKFVVHPVKPTAAATVPPIYTGPDPFDPFGGPEFGDTGSVIGNGASTSIAPGLEASSDGIGSGSASPPSPSPTVTPASARQEQSAPMIIDVDEFDLYDEEEMAARAVQERTSAVARGWKERWALTASQSKNTPSTVGTKSVGSSTKAKGKKKLSLSPVNLKRSNTNVTPAGLHSLNQGKQQKLPFVPTRKPRPVGPSTSVTFFQPKKLKVTSLTTAPIVIDDLSDEEDEIITVLSSPPPPQVKPVDETASRAESRLAKFRYS